MKEFIKNIKFVWKYSKGERKKIIFYFILTPITAAISLGYLLITSNIIVQLTDNKIYQFINMGFVLLIVEVINVILHHFKSILYEQIFRNIYINIQTNLGAEILKLNNKTLDNNGSGMFIQRLVGDTRNISSIFTNLNIYFNGILADIGIFVTYFILSKPVFLFVVIAFFLRLIGEIMRINIYNEKDKAYRKKNDSLTGFTGELVRGAKDIKMLNGESSFLQELQNKFEQINTEKYKMEVTNDFYLLLRRIWSALSYFIIMIIIADTIKKGTLSIPNGIILFNFGNRYNSLVQGITGFHELIKQFNLSATRIFDIFENDKFEKEQFGNQHLDHVEGNFEFQNVTFKYETNEVLKNLSFKVNANETVAFVGKSGAGKTTIFNLLCKMYDDYEGTITIDGIDIKSLDKDSIRGNITIVSQNPYIFNMSIKDNLKLLNKNLSEEEMKEACKMACLDDYIESLPNKYDTIVGEGGVMLSGGQKQRLAIARAFVQKTEIILFDEATSALDNETQAKIQSAIDNLQKDYTILMIAHRLSTIQNADRILMIENGTIIAEGTHKELLKTCIPYKELYNSEIKKDLK